MDLKGFRGNDIAFDIESGMAATEDTLWGVKQEKELLDRVWSSFPNVDQAVRGEEERNIGNVLVTHVDMPTENGASERKFGGEENVGVVGKKVGNGKPRRKNMVCQKAPKPPRPPRGPSLDASDQKMIQEISELAMLKRARVERVKALKKMKSAKASSSKSNFWALVITILFCLVIIWQGFSSKGHNVQSEGYPDSSVGTRGRLISVQYFRNVSPSANGSTSASPDITEPMSGLGFNGQDEASRMSG